MSSLTVEFFDPNPMITCLENATHFAFHTNCFILCIMLPYSSIALYSSTVTSFSTWCLNLEYWILLYLFPRCFNLATFSKSFSLGMCRPGFHVVYPKMYLDGTSLCFSVSVVILS